MKSHDQLYHEAVAEIVAGLYVNLTLFRIGVASLLLLSGLIFGTASASAQKPAATSAESTLVSQGWAALAAGELARASGIAGQAVSQYPRSAAAIALAVDVEIARGGAFAGLDAYERWLASRKLDDAYVLRRVAAALLRASSQQGKETGTRVEALKALAADGDAAAEAALAERVGAGSFADTYALASLGDRRAVQTLLSQLAGPGGNKQAIISALVASRSPAAVPPLMELLNSPVFDLRVAAADALGRLGATQAVDRIRPMLDDSNAFVRNTAAAALFRLGDNSGLPVLQGLLESEHPNVRLSALQAMSGNPDSRWQTLTRELTRDSDPVIRLAAARLIAPYDNQLAAATLQDLASDGNIAIREEAGRALSHEVAGDFGTLRRLLRSTDPLTSVRAADRILELTR